MSQNLNLQKVVGDTTPQTTDTRHAAVNTTAAVGIGVTVNDGY